MDLFTRLWHTLDIQLSFNKHVKDSILRDTIYCDKIIVTFYLLIKEKSVFVLEELNRVSNPDG